VTTGALDTTTATLILAGVISYAAVAAPNTPTDAKGNTYSGLTVQTTGTGARARLYSVANPTVGTGHTVTVTGGTAVVVLVAAYSGSLVVSPFDQENGATGTASPFAAGPVTPSQNNELLVALVGWHTLATVPTIDSGFTVREGFGYSAGDHFGGALADLIQTTGSAQHPAWAFGGAQSSIAAVIATFKAAIATGVSIPVAMSSYRQRRVMV